MSHESQPTPPSPESLFHHPQSVALKTRLAIGGNALEVDNKAVAKVVSVGELRDGFEKTHENTESRIAKASVGKRIEYWQKQEVKDKSEQMKKWKQDVTSLCHSQDNQDKIDTLSSRQIGAVDWKNITNEQVGQLHERYFGSSVSQKVTLQRSDGTTLQIASGTSDFVNEVIISYTNPDGTIDYASLQKDRSSLEFVAGIFGIDKLLFEYIDIVTTLKDEQRTNVLIALANQDIPSSSTDSTVQTTRINSLNSYEEEQLKLLSEGYEVKIEVEEDKKDVSKPPTTPPAAKTPVVVEPTPDQTHPVTHQAPVEKPGVKVVVTQPQAKPVEGKPQAATQTEPPTAAKIRELRQRIDEAIKTEELPPQPLPPKPTTRLQTTSPPPKPLTTPLSQAEKPLKPPAAPKQPTQFWPKDFYVTTPEQLIAMPVQERIRHLPEENLRAAIAFCDGLRARITNNGRENKIKRQGQDTSEWIDEPTRIHVLCPKREQITDAWFATNGFTIWADNHRLPLIYLVPANIHATLFLGMEKRAGKMGYLVYDPATKTGEQWRECLHQQTIDQYVDQLITNEPNYYRKPDRSLWRKPNATGPRLRQESKVNDHEIAEGYVQYITGIPTQSNTRGSALMMSGQYDLSLGKDPELPEEVVAGKIQQMQFDAKNCTAISFFAAALRYTAKPGKEDEKIRLIQDFENDFPEIRFLTRKEILGKKQQTQAYPTIPTATTKPRVPTQEEINQMVNAAETQVQQLSIKEFPINAKLIGQPGDGLRIAVRSTEIIEKANRDLLKRSWSQGAFHEEGGEFIGKRYQTSSGEVWTEICDYIPYPNSPNTSWGSLRISADMLADAQRKLYELNTQNRTDYEFIGWAHSHPPGWEGKMSEGQADDFINKNFFTQPGQFAYVFGAGLGSNTSTIFDTLNDHRCSFFSQNGNDQNFGFYSRHKGIYIKPSITF